MNKIARSAFRKMRKNIALLITASLLVAVGVGFFVTLFTITYRFDEAALEYFTEYNYADLTFYGTFDESAVATLNNQDAVELALGRRVSDRRAASGATYRIITITSGINDLYYLQGAAPIGASQCAVHANSARVMNLSIGDTLTADGQTLTVTALVGSPEYIYLSKSERSPMTNPKAFAPVYVNAEFFSDGGFNELLALSPNPSDVRAPSGTVFTLKQTEQINYELYQEQNNKTRTFAYIFPGVFACLVIMVVYVVLRRIAVKERMQIAVYKSLGASPRQILLIYLGQFLIFFLCAALIGALATILVTRILILIFSQIFTLPLLGYTFYPALWGYSIIAAFVVCLIPGICALFGILRKRPAEVMRPEQRGGKIILPQRIGFLWKRLSFNSRYTLKTMLRSKGRFFAIVLGIAATVALLTLSLGFYNSIDYVQTAYFDNFAAYDLTLSLGFNVQPFSQELPFIEEIPPDAEYAKVLQGRVRVNDMVCTLTVVEQESFNQLKLDTQLLSSGIIIPSYHARLWRVKAGDTLRAEIPLLGVTVYQDLRVSAVIDQTIAISLFASYEYLQALNPTAPPELFRFYNAVYMRTQNTESFTEYLNQNNITFSTALDDQNSFSSIMDTVRVLIMFMIICALILGVAVLYSVGLINLNSREGEYMLMQTLGYKHAKIMRTHTKETFMQILCALPFGYLCGWLLLHVIRGAFSSANFVLVAAVYPLTYVICAAIVAAIAVIMGFITARRINRLDIVEGLKSRD
ncbi:MAG: FtsX-like permease family protein [Firmicutes bacterium]|nr:FtsX-like permease family protein [Bacillota bacterium]